MENTAIIIKKLHIHGHKVALVDQKSGRINSVLSTKPIIEGAVVQYNVRGAGASVIMRDVEYLHVPLEWGKQDLLFLHHVLEICYFFIPVGSCATDIFNLLCFLLRMQQFCWTVESQKIFLCKLFLLLGVYPNTPFLKTKIAAQLLYISLEDMVQLKIDAQEQKAVDQWLKHCIMQHHRGFDFKTMIFLQRVGT